MIKKMLKACAFMSLILFVVLSIMVAVKVSYDNIPTVHSMIDALSPYLY